MRILLSILFAFFLVQANTQTAMMAGSNLEPRDDLFFQDQGDCILVFCTSIPKNVVTAGMSPMRVTTWYDFSGNDADAVQDGSGPSWIHTTGAPGFTNRNGRPLIDFDGGLNNYDSTLVIESVDSTYFLAAVNGSDVSIFTVVAPRADIGEQIGICGNGVSTYSPQKPSFSLNYDRVLSANQRFNFFIGSDTPGSGTGCTGNETLRRAFPRTGTGYLNEPNWGVIAAITDINHASDDQRVDFYKNGNASPSITSCCDACAPITSTGFRASQKFVIGGSSRTSGGGRHYTTALIMYNGKLHGSKNRLIRNRLNMLFDIF